MTGTDPATPSLPDAAAAPGTHRVPQIEHVVVVMMENHSYDNYFGALGDHGDGLPADAHNVAPDGRCVRQSPPESTGQAREIACQSWTSTHDQWADGTNAGFVRSAQRVAAVLDDDAVTARTDDVMGYWDAEQLPFYASLARTFPLADRWFGSCLGPHLPEPPVPGRRDGPRSGHRRTGEVLRPTDQRDDLRSAHPPWDRLGELSQHLAGTPRRLPPPRPRRAVRPSPSSPRPPAGAPARCSTSWSPSCSSRPTSSPSARWSTSATCTA